jgi:hypothetical protein
MDITRRGGSGETVVMRLSTVRMRRFGLAELAFGCVAIPFTIVNSLSTPVETGMQAGREVRNGIRQSLRA